MSLEIHTHFYLAGIKKERSSRLPFPASIQHRFLPDQGGGVCCCPHAVPLCGHKKEGRLTPPLKALRSTEVPSLQTVMVVSLVGKGGSPPWQP